VFLKIFFIKPINFASELRHFVTSLHVKCWPCVLCDAGFKYDEYQT